MPSAVQTRGHAHTRGDARTLQGTHLPPRRHTHPGSHGGSPGAPTCSVRVQASCSTAPVHHSGVQAAIRSKPCTPDHTAPMGPPGHSSAVPTSAQKVSIRSDRAGGQHRPPESGGRPRIRVRLLALVTRWPSHIHLHGLLSPPPSPRPQQAHSCLSAQQLRFRGSVWAAVMGHVNRADRPPCPQTRAWQRPPQRLQWTGPTSRAARCKNCKGLRASRDSGCPPVCDTTQDPWRLSDNRALSHFTPCTSITLVAEKLEKHRRVRETTVPPGTPIPCWDLVLCLSRGVQLPGTFLEKLGSPPGSGCAPATHFQARNAPPPRMCHHPSPPPRTAPPCQPPDLWAQVYPAARPGTEPPRLPGDPTHSGVRTAKRDRTQGGPGPPGTWGTSGPSGRLTELLGALALAGQLPHLHEGVEVAFGGVGDTCGGERGSRLPSDRTRPETKTAGEEGSAAWEEGSAAWGTRPPLRSPWASRGARLGGGGSVTIPDAFSQDLVRGHDQALHPLPCVWWSTGGTRSALCPGGLKGVCCGGGGPPNPKPPSAWLARPPPDPTASGQTQSPDDRGTSVGMQLSHSTGTGPPGLRGVAPAGLGLGDKVASLLSPGPYLPGLSRSSSPWR